MNTQDWGGTLHFCKDVKRTSGAAEAQDAELADLQTREGPRDECHRLQRHRAAPVLRHRPRVVHRDHHLRRKANLTKTF